MQESRDVESATRRRKVGLAGTALALLAGTVVIAFWFAGMQITGRSFLRKSDAPVRLEADLSTRELYMRRGSEVIGTYGIAVGTATHPTPEGDYSIHLIVWNPGWVPPPNSAWARGKMPREPGDPANPMQGVKIYFREPAYFIHGTNDPESIGSAASHGCIRMAPEDAEDLARRLMEYAGAGESDEWFASVREHITGTRYISLPVSIPLVIRD